MLAIRMQRVGRKGHPEFRVVVQDSRLTPTSGRIVARLGHVNPHTKAITLDKEKTEAYLNNGAQPSPRVVRMLQAEKITLPAWVVTSDNSKKRNIKNTEKLRRNRPVEEKVEEPKEEAVAESQAEESKVESPETEAEVATPVDETPAEVAVETVSEEPTAEEPIAEPETAEPESTES
ncbi:30S ribosomal protein S16 [Candidatus Saccharibacteria bacterium]|jgi:small subunit ribosomal protein S16|nr:30S ribosomal protein S16 [Candidatus Saccharibacteria bacterium]